VDQYQTDGFWTVPVSSGQFRSVLSPPISKQPALGKSQGSDPSDTSELGILTVMVSQCFEGNAQF
jgi:hypothetical protein